MCSGAIDLSVLHSKVVHPSAGAVSSFVGITRDNDNGKQVTRLEYESYTPMAIKVMKQICGEMRTRWGDISRIAIVHKLGVVDIGCASVAIFVSSPHRKESLAAVQYAIDELKERVPVWKKEFFVEPGEEAVWKANVGAVGGGQSRMQSDGTITDASQTT